jgi:sensor c-di-GMP phosphodiesterase-like protein
MLVTMTTSLDLKLIVEGIEKNDQRELLTSAGVQYGQGFLFSAPFLRAGDK